MYGKILENSPSGLSRNEKEVTQMSYTPEDFQRASEWFEELLGHALQGSEETYLEHVQNIRVMSLFAQKMLGEPSDLCLSDADEYIVKAVVSQALLEVSQQLQGEK